MKKAPHWKVLDGGIYKYSHIYTVLFLNNMHTPFRSTKVKQASFQYSKQTNIEKEGCITVPQEKNEPGGVDILMCLAAPFLQFQPFPWDGEICM